MDIRKRGRREKRGSTWISFAPLPSPSWPAEANRMSLGHIRSHDQYAVTVCQILKVGGCSTTTKEPPRPGTLAECQIRA